MMVTGRDFGFRAAAAKARETDFDASTIT